MVENVPRSSSWLPLMLALTSGCGSCSESLEAEGPHPHVRCLAMDADDFERTVGDLRFVLTGGVLTIEGSAQEWLAFAIAPRPSLEGLPEAPLRIVLGGFARDAASASATLRALAAAGPTLLLPGGEDDVDVLDEALEAVDDPALIDLRGIRLLRHAGHEWAVVPGAPGGRYGRGERACGFTPSDLEDLALPDPRGLRHLASWVAPANLGAVSAGLGAVDVGSIELGVFAQRVGAVGGVSSWPRQSTPTVHRAGEGAWVGVPIWGRVVEAPDGRWSHGDTYRMELTGGPSDGAPVPEESAL